MTNFKDNRRCFVCGEENPHGLKLKFRLDRSRGAAETEIVFPDGFQGWDGIALGGLTAAVLDEGMIKAAAARDMRTVTAEITVRYVHPVRTGVVHGGRGPGLYPGVLFRRTRPWLQATGEWRAEGSSLDKVRSHVVESKGPIVFAKSEISDPKGRVVARAQGKMFRLEKAGTR